MAGACDFFPPFSFWAAIISCLCVQHLQVPSSLQELQLPSFLLPPCGAFLPQPSSVGQAFSPAQF